MLFLAGCAEPRLTVVDAVSGAPLTASVRELTPGRWLVEVSGYETHVANSGELVALAPLWQARFMTAAERRLLRSSHAGQRCCPGTATQ
jgi:hypothetical protein